MDSPCLTVALSAVKVKELNEGGEGIVTVAAPPFPPNVPLIYRDPPDALLFTVIKPLESTVAKLSLLLE